MKILSLIFISTLFISCGTQKEVTENIESSSTEEAVVEEAVTEEVIDQTSENYRVIGIVRENSKGCDFCVETEIAPGEFKFLYVVNLEDQYKSDGQKIKFDYALSRAMIPEGCSAEMTVSISDVTRLRN